MLITVFGKRGSGKTTVIRDMIKDQKKPVVIIDVLGNFDPEADKIQEKKNPNNKKWVFCQNTPDAIDEIANYVDNPKSHPGVIVVQDGNIDRCTDFISSALWKIEGGTLIIDECDAIRIADAPCFNELIRYGRNKGIDLITGCRRPAELDKNITAGADVIYCFTTHEIRDIDYFRVKFGDDLANTLPSLPPYHGIYIDYLNNVTGEYKSNERGEITILTRTSTLRAAIPTTSKKKNKRSKDNSDKTDQEL